jgi:hypothetical protein
MEQVVDTGLDYRQGDPVRVWVVRRAQRITVSDRGAAMERAAVSMPWRPVADRLARVLNVNVNSSGAVWLPVVRAGPGEAAIIERIAQASLSFYQDLLDLE